MADIEALRDGWVSVAGGVNTSIVPCLIQDSQFAMGVNVSSRSGLLHTRPRWQRVPFYIPSGRFQGAFIFRSRIIDYLAVVVDGALYLINLATGVRIYCDTFPTTDFDRAYFVQADRYLIVQNGITRPTENWPIIMDSQLLLDNGTVQIFTSESGWAYLGDQVNYNAKRVPIGTHMAYGQGRLFVTVSRLWDNGLLSGSAQWLYQAPNKYFVAGDILAPDNPDSVLAFTELDYLAQGGAFSLPTEHGEVTGMQFYRNAATGTGVGELIVAGEYGLSAFGVGAPRAQWADISLAQSLFSNHGVESDRAFIPVNNDLAFRSVDGIRFMRFSKSDSEGSGSLVSLPQSMEISTLLDLDSATERHASSMACVDERVFLTTGAAELADATVNTKAFSFIAPLDLYVIGATQADKNFNAKGTPAFDGLWNGPEMLQILNIPRGDDSFLGAISRVSDTQTELWILDPTATYDGESDRPLCRVETKSFEWGDPTVLKEFKFAEVWLSDLRGPLDITMYWRSDNYALWVKCNSIHVEACDTGERQARYALRFSPTAEGMFDPVSNRTLTKGYEFQFCLEWRGVAMIEKVRLISMPQPLPTPNVGCDIEVCVPITASGSTGEVLTPPAGELTPLAAIKDPGEWTAQVRPTGALFWTQEPYLGDDGNWHVPYFYTPGKNGGTAPTVHFGGSNTPSVNWTPETPPGDTPAPGNNDYGPSPSIGPGEVIQGEVIVPQVQPNAGQTQVDPKLYWCNGPACYKVPVEVPSTPLGDPEAGLEAHVILVANEKVYSGVPFSASIRCFDMGPNGYCRDLYGQAGIRIGDVNLAAMAGQATVSPSTLARELWTRAIRKDLETGQLMTTESQGIDFQMTITLPEVV